MHLTREMLLLCLQMLFNDIKYSFSLLVKLSCSEIPAKISKLLLELDCCKVLRVPKRDLRAFLAHYHRAAALITGVQGVPLKMLRDPQRQQALWRSCREWRRSFE